MFSQFLGFLGMVCVVYAYHKLTSLNGWKSDSVIFNTVNLSGALLLIISLCFHFNFGSFMIEVFWIAIASKALYKKSKVSNETD